MWVVLCDANNKRKGCWLLASLAVPTWELHACSERLSEAHLSLGLWQPDVCPQSLLPHEQMTALLSMEWPEEYPGIGALVFYCKTGAGNWRSFFSFVEHGLYFTKTSGPPAPTPSSEQLRRKCACRCNLWCRVWGQSSQCQLGPLKHS